MNVFHFSTLATWTPLLLAGTRRVVPIRSRYRGGGSLLDSLLPVAVTVAILALIVAIAWGLHYWYQLRKLRVVDSPAALFAELCRAHDLPRADRQFLLDVAAWYELSDPVVLFLDDQRWRNRRLWEELNCQADAERLAQQLFG